MPQVTARQIEQPGVRQTERRCHGQSGCIREESARKETKAKAKQRCQQGGSGDRQDLALEPDRSRAPGQGQAGLPAGIPP